MIQHLASILKAKMPIEMLNPPGAPRPFSRYSQAVLVPSGYRWLHVSGQVGCDLGGGVAEGFEAQARLAWTNLIAVLEGAGFAIRDLVRVGILLTNREDVAASRRIRDEMLNGAAPASTLMIVVGLAGPDMMIEVEGVAAQAAT
jgi:enamine deaminase RidA (YjgF/YER057c/UK114 family)